MLERNKHRLLESHWKHINRDLYVQRIILAKVLKQFKNIFTVVRMKQLDIHSKKHQLKHNLKMLQRIIHNEQGI